MRLINRTPDRSGRLFLVLLPFALLLFAYFAGSTARLAENPNDKLLPSAAQMADAVNRLAFSEDKRTGDVLFWQDTGASLQRLGMGLGIAALLGLVLGIALVMIRSRVRWVLLGVLGFLRAIPVLMLIFWSYFLLPIVFNVDVPALATVVCALSLIGGAYLAHSVYAGISSLPAGQWAAGKALGLGTWQVLRLIILPQALPMMLPSFLNQWISLIKDTSLAYVIGVGELSFVATQVSNRVMVHPTEIYLFVALVYFVFCSSLDLIANRLIKPKAQPR